MRVAFLTLGCKVNQYETQLLKEQFLTLGYEETEINKTADVYIINSCTVTAYANKKARQAIHKIRRENPQAIIALTGCFPQAFPQEATEISEADIICGAKEKLRIYELIKEFSKNHERIIRIFPHKKGEKFESQSTTAHEDKTRAFLKIEDGCERFCAYCIIPKARGPVRSKPIDEIIKETEILVKNGYKEIVLVGINLAMYGYDIGLRLIDAVREVCRVDGVQRVRLGSSEPMLVTAEDFKEMATFKNICPQFHVALQSGCNKTLKHMGRIYNTDEYRQIINVIKSDFENPAITTDIIVGFPGETDEDFAQTVNFVKEAGFAQTHIFPYSRRENTAADQMPDQVPEFVKTERAKQLHEICNAQRQKFLESQVGTVAEVLFENTVTNLGRKGHSLNYTPVFVDSPQAVRGEIHKVRIKATTDDGCIGEIID